MSASAYRHLRSRTKFRKYLRIVPVVGLLVAAGIFFLHDEDAAPRHAQPFNAPPLTTSVITAKAPEGVTVTDTPVRSARMVYPHSVVAGGVHSRNELLTAIRSDRVVAAHYANINTDAAHTVRVDAPRAVHVSYRIGDKVYWTAKKVMLAKGETLLTDGVNEMRARCGNRISDQPQLPVSAEEPSVELLDAAMPLDSEGIFVASANGQAGSAGNGNPVASTNSGARSGRGGAPGGQSTNLSTVGAFFTATGSTNGTQPVTGSGSGTQSTAPLPTLVEINPAAPPDGGAADGSLDGNSGATPPLPSQANGIGPGPGNPGLADFPAPPGLADFPGNPGLGDLPGLPGTPAGDPQDPATVPDKELLALLAPGTLPDTVRQDGQADTGDAPEPATFWLIGAALASLALLRRAASARAAARLHSSQPPSNTAI